MSDEPKRVFLVLDENGMRLEFEPEPQVCPHHGPDTGETSPCCLVGVRKAKDKKERTE